uniref:Uncharacterized 30.8 kDa protein in rpl12-rps7 intergenic region n=1 Tax=Euglena longa TaxID=3037 RepID=YCY4_EUGLO|nr:hypothetical protein AsloCp35 [Euglena longa]P58149.1 RecName: Full=Uncharacterized 30.8 kDa protein in rpl12-rps7 intergenic region; AltName: Full=ORF253 [Euglena longa]CAC24606.1 hypothetical protein [Euglena longa]
MYIYRKPYEQNYWNNFILLSLYVNNKRVGVNKNITKLEYILLDIFLHGPLHTEFINYLEITNYINNRTYLYEKMLKEKSVNAINIILPPVMHTASFEYNYEIIEDLDSNKILNIYILNNKCYYCRKLKDDSYWEKFPFNEIPIFVNDKKVGLRLKTDKLKTTKNLTKVEYYLLDIFWFGPLKIEASEHYEKIMRQIKDRNKKYMCLYYEKIINGINIIFNISNNIEYKKFLNNDYSIKEMINVEHILTIYVLT